MDRWVVEREGQGGVRSMSSCKEGGHEFTQGRRDEFMSGREYEFVSGRQYSTSGRNLFFIFL